MKMKELQPFTHFDKDEIGSDVEDVELEESLGEGSYKSFDQRKLPAEEGGKINYKFYFLIQNAVNLTFSMSENVTFIMGCFMSCVFQLVLFCLSF